MIKHFPGRRLQRRKPALSIQLFVSLVTIATCFSIVICAHARADSEDESNGPVRHFDRPTTPALSATTPTQSPSLTTTAIPANATTTATFPPTTTPLLPNISNDGGTDTTVKTTPQGVVLMVTQKIAQVRPVRSLDSSPLSREAFIDSTSMAAIEAQESVQIQEATFEAGYQIGYPLQVGGDGADLTLAPPKLSLSEAIGSLPGLPHLPALYNTSTENPDSDPYPPNQSLNLTVKYGEIKEVPLYVITLSNNRASLDLSGVHISVAGALGTVTIRTYCRLIVKTNEGVGLITAYGDSVRL